MWGNRVLRCLPLYVARIACGFSDPNDFAKARFPKRRKMLEAIRIVGLQLKSHVEVSRVCPLCGKGADRGRRLFKDRRGLYHHMRRKHYYDLMELVFKTAFDMGVRKIRVRGVFLTPGWNMRVYTKV
jgi:hypothetical protein